MPQPCDPLPCSVGKMIELLGSKAAVSSGRFHYGTAFGEPSGLADKVEDIDATSDHSSCLFLNLFLTLLRPSPPVPSPSDSPPDLPSAPLPLREQGGRHRGHSGGARLQLQREGHAHVGDIG